MCMTWEVYIWPYVVALMVFRTSHWCILYISDFQCSESQWYEKRNLTILPTTTTSTASPSPLRQSWRLLFLIMYDILADSNSGDENGGRVDRSMFVDCGAVPNDIDRMSHQHVAVVFDCTCTEAVLSYTRSCNCSQRDMCLA